MTNTNRQQQTNKNIQLIECKQIKGEKEMLEHFFSFNFNALKLDTEKKEMDKF